MTIRDFLEGAAAIIQSQFATLILLLVLLGLMARWMQHRLKAEEEAVQQRLKEQELAWQTRELECRRDLVTFISFFRSAMGIARDFRMLLISVTGGPSRAPPDALGPIDRHLDELRRKVHDYETEMKLRLNQALEKVRERQEEVDRK